jgi:uncharacterized protein (TIGR00290 family)
VNAVSIYGENFFCSWSGGKDSALAFCKAVREGGRPQMLLTMLHEDGERSRSHGLPISVFKSQASSLGVPLMLRSATWDDYEAVFMDALSELKGMGVSAGVFGDIDIEEHREWVHKVCRSAGLRPYHPLWGQDRRALLDELLKEGFEATIVAVNKDALDKDFLGKRITRDVINQLESQGVDASGERGEYHSVVTNGPLFSRPIKISTNKIHERDGYLFLDVAVPKANTCLDSTDIRGG